MESITSKLQENLQVLYRKAIDADRALDILQSQGQAKHKTIFPDDAGFKISSTRFVPYLEELALEVKSIDTTPQESQEELLASVVKKMEVLFVTLANLQSTLVE